MISFLQCYPKQFYIKLIVEIIPWKGTIASLKDLPSVLECARKRLIVVWTHSQLTAKIRQAYAVKAST